MVTNIWSSRILRVVIFFLTIVLSVVLGWWVFFLLGVVYFILVRTPLEIVVIGAVMDKLFYLGEGLFYPRIFLIFSVIVVAMSAFFENRVQWPKIL